MAQKYMYPKLITLEGDGSDFPVPGISMSGAYKQQDTYRSQDFAVMGADWGFFNFLRPSRAQTWLSAGGAVLQAIPKTEALGKGLSAGGQVAAGIASSYQGGSGDPPYQGTGYQPNDSTKTKIDAGVEKKKVPWLPIAIGAAGIAAAIGLS